MKFKFKQPWYDWK